MKKYIVNKNISYGKAVYLKDSEISESDLGFKDLLNAGHVIAMAKSGQEAPAVHAEEAPMSFDEPVKEKVITRKGRK